MRSVSSNVLLVLSIGLPLGMCILCFISGTLLDNSLAELSGSEWKSRLMIVCIGVLMFSPLVPILLYLQRSSKK